MTIIFGLSLCDASGCLGDSRKNVAHAGGTATVSTAPTTAGASWVAAEIQNVDGDPIEVTAVSYTANPTGVPIFDVGGGFVDLKITGADAMDSAVASFYYPSTVTGEQEASLALLYFNGNAWVPVQSGAGFPLVKDTTDNSNGTVSGGRFDVVFDSTSLPAITELSGTVFAMTEAADSPPVMTCPPDLTVECNTPTDPTVTGRATAIDNRDPNPVITYLDNIAGGDCPDARTITRVWIGIDCRLNKSLAWKRIRKMEVHFRSLAAIFGRVFWL